MDHAEAHERIADLALDPGALAAALDARDPRADTALIEHLAGCERCRADVAAWSGLHASLERALRRTEPGGHADIEPIEPAADLRRAVLASAMATTEPAGRVPAGPRPIALLRPRVPSWVLGLAAAFVVAVGGTLLLAGPGQQLTQQLGEARALSGVVASLDRILADSTHRTVGLRDNEGQPAGTISWSSHDLVVLTAAIKTPAAGRVYRCWLSGPNGDTPIGAMEFAGGTAYWVGSLDDWASISLSPGTAFYVTLENAPAGSARSGPVVLEGEL